MKSKIILALAAGIIGLTGNALAATSVTTYSPTNQPSWLHFDYYNGGGSEMYTTPYTIAYDDSDTQAPYVFTRGSDFTGPQKPTTSVAPYTFWQAVDEWSGGAVAGDSNYANLDLTEDGVFESVGQFHFDLTNSSYLIAVASSDSGALSISAGKTAIASSTSAVPEASTSLGLLALGAGGLLTRRRTSRKA